MAARCVIYPLLVDRGPTAGHRVTPICGTGATAPEGSENVGGGKSGAEGAELLIGSILLIMLAAWVALDASTSSASTVPPTFAFSHAAIGDVAPQIPGRIGPYARTTDSFAHSSRPHSFGDVWDDVKVAAQNNVSDFAHIYTAPARINRNSALWLGGIMLVGGALYAYDQEIYDALKRNEFDEPYRWVRETGEFFEPVGHQGKINKYLFGGMAVGYVTGFESLTTFSSDILRSFMITAPGKSSANALVGRRGPRLGRGPRSFDFGKGRSFPSGHSLAIATVARVVTYRIRFWPIQAVAYTMLGTVLLQRVTSTAHWPADAYFGGLYGWFVTDELLRRRDTRGEKIAPDGVDSRVGAKTRVRVEIAPLLPMQDRGTGVSIRLQW